MLTNKLLTIATSFTMLFSMTAWGSPASDMAAANYVSRILAPSLNHEGWTAHVYKSQVLKGHSLIWVTMGGYCNDHDFVLDLTNPRNLQVFNVIQGINNGNNAYNRSDSNVAQLQPLRDELSNQLVTLGVLSLPLIGPAAATLLIPEDLIQSGEHLDELSAGRQLKESLELFVAGKDEQARDALPHPLVCQN